MTFGIFQEYYSKHPPLQGSKGVPWIGVLGTGIPFLGSPLMTHLSKKFRLWQTHFVWCGWALCVTSLATASFCRSLGSLAATQGCLYGLGFLILYYPVLSMLNEWFIKRRGLAYGLLFGAAGTSGIVLPFITEILLTRYGYRTTLRAFAVGIFALSGPAIVQLRGRDRGWVVRSGFEVNTPAYFHSSHFYLLALSNLFQGFAFYLPLIYLPSYATDMGYSPKKGALLLALANAAQVVGQIVFGQLSDKINVHVLLMFSSGVSAVATLTLWPLGKTLGPLAVFAVLYGSFAGGYVVLWPRIGTLLCESKAQEIYGILAFEKGIGNVLSGPISSTSIHHVAQHYDYALGKYQGIVVFVGLCMAISAVLAGAALLTVCCSLSHRTP